MKIIINACHGGFGVREDITKKYDLHDFDDVRTNPVLIKLIESGVKVSPDYSDLQVVSIPDESTDYIIDEYDGLESIIYVVDGKIHRIY